MRHKMRILHLFCHSYVPDFCAQKCVAVPHGTSVWPGEPEHTKFNKYQIIPLSTPWCVKADYGNVLRINHYKTPQRPSPLLAAISKSRVQQFFCVKRKKCVAVEFSRLLRYLKIPSPILPCPFMIFRHRANTITRTPPGNIHRPYVSQGQFPVGQKGLMKMDRRGVFYRQTDIARNMCPNNE
jgi:hypothetical protein